ncbi:unnamed protein product [Ilex paraguariensis]|uniref:Uncharacterized protein n=1 Tax=Ilex paraguariensis TaxID=185542 RepID=A0ABC8QQU9_9AQUA
MNLINCGTIKKSLGQGKNKKTQPQQSLGKEKNKKTQPQVEIQNEAAPEDNIAAQAVSNSSTSGLPSLDERLSIYASVMIRMGRMMEEFGNTQNALKESLKFQAEYTVYFGSWIIQFIEFSVSSQLPVLSGRGCRIKEVFVCALRLLWYLMIKVE